ncbi:helix-turn-helix domain-containing protein [uncultured Metabacillus sp.]|uniref:helix-turn-helix domain-containing protein n=1 Tax=uncultured Metabacillus sp. TaxID=2860135 RepID=UPI0026290D7E|nr:helix-turn-helix domain-containing protein [uncultured Metabacillus sp.]
MKHGYFHLVLLYCIKQFNGERSLSAIYHLLNGKKSSQTIQDGKLFNLSHMFSLFPRLSRQYLNEACEELLQEDLLELLPNQHYFVTDKGKFMLNERLAKRPLPAKLNGWEYGDLGRIFWRRLSLLVQVLSNFVYERKQYLPLTKNQEDLLWVKSFLNQIPISKSDLAEELYKEIKDFLLLQTTNRAAIFTQRLTSSQTIGLTFEQIARKHNEDPTFVYLLFWDVIHSMVDFQKTEKQDSIFYAIIKDKRQNNSLTSSSAKTRAYLLQGITLQDIAAIRKLKISTIEDHIVEITLHDQSFIPSAFLSTEDFEEISEAIKSLHTHQLKKIKEYLNHKYSYFQIRLAFAINGRNG